MKILVVLDVQNDFVDGTLSSLWVKKNNWLLKRKNSSLTER